jgi:hypothetical protein
MNPEGKRKEKNMNPVEKANRALWAACMGNMSLAGNWLQQAEASVAQNQSEASFIAHAHPSNTAKARAAHRLAVLNSQEPRLRVKNRIAGKCIIYFARRFTRGTLAGITCDDKIPHVDRWHAAQWLKGIRANVRRGVLEYKLTAAQSEMIGGAK